MWEAQWWWYSHKLDTLGGIQSVENQVGHDQKEGPACKLVQYQSHLNMIYRTYNDGDTISNLITLVSTTVQLYQMN